MLERALDTPRFLVVPKVELRFHKKKYLIEKCLIFAFVGNLYLLQFPTPEIIFHPPISVHMTLIVGRINIGKCRKIFISLNRMRVQSRDMRVQSRDIFANSFLCIITKHFNSVDISVKTFTGSNDCL